MSLRFLLKWQDFKIKFQKGFRKFCIASKVPINMVRVASAFLIMLSFGCFIPLAVFAGQIFGVKCLAVFFASAGTYYLCEALLSNAKKK